MHHGGTGTTAAGLRAGIPTLILWIADTQPYMGAAVKRLKVGATRRFLSTTEKSLVADLRKILAPHYLTRAREIASQMTKPADSIAAAADLLENFALVGVLAHRRRAGQRMICAGQVSRSTPQNITY